MNFRMNEVPYKMARRTYHRLLRKHRGELADRDEFEAADRSICPELWDAVQKEPPYAVAAGDIEARLFVTVADAYGLDTTLLDDTILAADYREFQRQMESEVERSFASAGVCAYAFRGLECRNAPINAPGTCGCKRG